MVSAAFQRVRNVLNSRPALSSALTLSFMLGLGDFGCQAIERQLYPSAQNGGVNGGFAATDWTRTRRVAELGFIFAGPAMGVWFPFLQRSVPKALHAYKHGPLVFKVLAQQFIFGPTMNTAFFGWIQLHDVWDESRLSGYENGTRQSDFFSADFGKKRFTGVEFEIFKTRWWMKLKSDLLHTVAVSCCWWIPFNTVMFLTVPVTFQPIVAQVGLIIWSTYLSLVGHKHPPAIHEMKTRTIQMHTRDIHKVTN